MGSDIFSTQFKNQVETLCWFLLTINVKNGHVYNNCADVIYEIKDCYVIFCESQCIAVH